MSKKVLIIGGVAGGASTAARLRRLDETADITIFERGPYISYANCGLPYHVGGVIQERESLLLQSPEAMSEKYNINVRVNNEVVSIDRENKQIEVKRVDNDEVYREDYDVLVIATGSSPLKPPIPGIDADRIFPLWTIPDTDRVKAYLQTQQPKRAVVVGCGFIGLEMAENLHAAGCEVAMVEMADQVMPPLDFEMARILQTHLVEEGVALHLANGVSAFEQTEDAVTVVLADGKRVEADLAILAIGVRPNGKLAREAGLSVNKRGGIVTDAYLKTSDPDIYAVGDVIEVTDFVFQGDRTMIPLAGPANKQGRIRRQQHHAGAKRNLYEGSHGHLRCAKCLI